MQALTQRDREFLLGELQKYTGGDPHSVVELVRAASDWVRSVGSTPGLGAVLVRDVTALCAYARTANQPEAKRLAAGALAFILRDPSSSAAGLPARAFAASTALHEIRNKCGEGSHYDPIPVSASERQEAESLFLCHAETPLYADPELIHRSRAFCDDIRPLAAAPFLARLVRGVQFLVDALESDGIAESKTWARAGLSYLLRTEDSIDDRLGFAGLLDDLLVVETAVHFIDPERGPWNNLLSALFSAWPFLLDVLLVDEGAASSIPDFVLLNAAFGCADLLGDAQSPRAHLAVVTPLTGPLPFLVSFLVALAEQSRRLTQPHERFTPGDLVLVDGDGCAVYRGRRLSADGTLRLRLEQPSRSARAGLSWHDLPLTDEVRLTPAPPKRKPGGRIGVSLAGKRAVNALQRLFHLSEPTTPDSQAKKILVVTPTGAARRFAEQIALHGSPLHEVLPLGHLNRIGQITSWSLEAFGGQVPLLLCSPVALRAAEYLEKPGHGVGLLVLDLDDPSMAPDAELRRLLDAGVPTLAFIRDDEAREEVLALFAEKGAKSWEWCHQDLRQILWREPLATDTLARFERRVRASIEPNVQVLSATSAAIDETYARLLGLRRYRGNNEDAVDVLDDVIGAGFGVLVGLMRSVGIVTADEASSHRERLRRAVLVVAGNRFLSEEERQAVLALQSAAERAISELERRNPKEEAIATVTSGKEYRVLLSEARAALADIDPGMPLIVSAWFGRDRMSRLLSPPASSEILLALYGPESAWFAAFRERRFRQHDRLPDESRRRAIFSGLDLRWSRPTLKAPLPAPPPPDAPDFDSVRQEVFEARRRRLLKVPANPDEVTVDAHMLIFRERAAAFLSRTFDANVVTHLIQRSAAAGGDATVKVRHAAQLVIGDVLLFSEGDRDAIREQADLLLPAGMRERTRHWQLALRRWMKHRDLTPKAACELLSAHGCPRHPLTIRHWALNDNLIGPGHDGDIRHIADLTEDAELRANLDACEEAVRVVRGAHLRAAGILAEKVVAAAASALAAAPDQIIKFDDVLLVTVEYVEREVTPVPRSRVNRLFFDEANSGGDSE